MRKLILLFGLVFLLAAGCDSSTSTSSSLVPDNDVTSTRSFEETGDMDCTDFGSHSEAQDFFEEQGSGDPHGLDRDGDGLACETL